MSNKRRKRQETPLLKAYLRAAPSYPSHVPAWIVPAGWALFACLALTLALLLDRSLAGSAIVSAVISYFAVMLTRAQFKPKTEAERADEKVFAVIRKLKFFVSEGSLQRKLPFKVQVALEGAVEAYNTALTRQSLDDPIKAMESAGRVATLLHACFFAAAPLIRDDNMSSKEWRHINDNEPFINEIVAAIEHQTQRMMVPPDLIDSERLAALKELDDLHHPADSSARIQA